MVNDRKKIFQTAKELLEKDKIYFIEDLIAVLPISKPTFYDYFKVDSNEFNELKSILENNKIEVKKDLRSKWHKSDNPTLQLSLYKLITDDEERKKLSMTHTDITTDGKELPILPPIILQAKEVKE